MKESMPQPTKEAVAPEAARVNPATERALNERRNRFDHYIQLALRGDPEKLIEEKTTEGVGGADKLFYDAAFEAAQLNTEDDRLAYFLERIKDDIDRAQTKTAKRSKANELFLQYLRHKALGYLENRTWEDVDVYDIKRIIESFELHEATEPGTMLNARLRVEFEDAYKKAKRLIKKGRNYDARSLLRKAKNIAGLGGGFVSGSAKKIVEDVDRLLQQ